MPFSVLSLVPNSVTAQASDGGDTVGWWLALSPHIKAALSSATGQNEDLKKCAALNCLRGFSLVTRSAFHPQPQNMHVQQKSIGDFKLPLNVRMNGGFHSQLSQPSINIC